jgi:hypothetical protein
MRKAIGLLIILAGLSHFFEQSFDSFDNAASQSLKTLETAAFVTEQRLLK